MRTAMDIEHLEELSDKVRKGIPVDLIDAIEVIKYQQTLREKREKSAWLRFKHRLKWGASQ